MNHSAHVAAYYLDKAEFFARHCWKGIAVGWLNLAEHELSAPCSVSFEDGRLMSEGAHSLASLGQT